MEKPLFCLGDALTVFAPTHAAFVLDMRMAKDPEKVRTFLVDLAQKLRPLQEQEVKVYLEYKKEEVGPVCVHCKV